MYSKLRVLRASCCLQRRSSRPASGDDARDPEASHFLRRCREDAQFLMDAKVRWPREGRPHPSFSGRTLWEHVSTYKTSYDEKLLLVDREEAGKIADAIERTSERGEETTFVDADGGFSRVTEELLAKRGLFKRCKLFDKDPRTWQLRERALASYLGGVEAQSAEVNVNSFPVSDQHYLGDFVSGLYQETQDLPESRWEDEAPCYTLFGIGTHPLLKYLTGRCILRDSYRFGEFSGGRRPEFYFVVSSRTWLHMQMRRKLHLLQYNVLFQLMFDFELVATVDRRSFAPWKKTRYGCSSTGALYKELGAKHMYLMRARPKVDVGLENGSASGSLLSSFVGVLTRKRNHRVLPFLEKWNANAALECVREGLPVDAIGSDLRPNDFLALFNVLSRQKYFGSCHFSLMFGDRSRAEDYSGLVSDDYDNPNIRRSYMLMKRKLRME